MWEGGGGINPFRKFLGGGEGGSVKGSELPGSGTYACRYVTVLYVVWLPSSCNMMRLLKMLCD